MKVVIERNLRSRRKLPMEEEEIEEVTTTKRVRKLPDYSEMGLEELQKEHEKAKAWGIMLGSAR